MKVQREVALSHWRAGGGAVVDGGGSLEHYAVTNYLINVVAII